MRLGISLRRARLPEAVLVICLPLFASHVFSAAVTGAAHAQAPAQPDTSAAAPMTGGTPAPAAQAVTTSVVDRAAKPENQFLQRDIEVVANWIAQCMGAPTVHDLPKRYANALGVYEWGFYVNDGYPDFPIVKEDTIKNQHLPSSQQMEALSISRVIYENSLDAAENARTFESQAYVLQWAIVGLGVVTTVISSLNSARLWAEQGLANRVIKILAIVFPALTTAAAAMNTFVNPTERVALEKRNLAALGQLHDRIAQEIWLLSCKDAPSNEDKLIVWRQRIQEIANGANTSRPKTGGSDSGNATVNPKK